MPSNILSTNGTTTISTNIFYTVGYHGGGVISTSTYGPSLRDIINSTPTEPQPPRSTWVNPYRNCLTQRRWPLENDIRIDRPVDKFVRVRQAIYTAQERKWCIREMVNYKLHPAIESVLRNNNHPADMHQLVLEWPHVPKSESGVDEARVAYTQNDDKGERDIQTVTSLGKYLKRHWPDLPDHVLRDFVMRHMGFTFELWDTTYKIIESVQKGPKSCMQWPSLDDWNEHPYCTYAPEYGWRAAVRLDGGKRIVGRCLVNVTDNTFVRSYAHRDDGYSYSDEALEAWLREQGFSKASDWGGHKLKYFKVGYDFIAPYIDGSVQSVDIEGNHLFINEDGDYLCNNTDGRAEEHGCRCEHCDSRVHEDDLASVGYHSDSSACRDCISEYFTYVYGRRGVQYYVHNDNAVHSPYDDNYYDADYISDNNMVWLDDGDLCPQDDAVHLESRDEWHHCDSSDVVYCEHNSTYEHVDDVVELADGAYALEDDTWECEIDGAYYLNDDADKMVSLCDVNNKTEYNAHEDAAMNNYDVDLDDVATACEEMLETTEAN